MRLKFLIAYEGTAYRGWQIQCRDNPPPTIQGTVEKALATITGHAVRIYGSGRTDAGVHAHGQVAHADLPDSPSRPHRDWRNSLNALLPPDIRILEVKEADVNFHARESAIDKTYIYHFWQEPAFIPPYLRNFVWPCGVLDYDRMLEALPLLRGSHDFASFQNTGTCCKTTVREIFSITLSPQPGLPFYPPHLPMLQLSVTANGFLKQMTRNIAGCLAHIARGKMAPSALPAILEAKSRKMLPSPTAPASGLFLAHVRYSH